jgi:hypothetical protein
MRLGDEGHSSDTNVGVGSIDVGEVIRVGDAVRACAGAEVGGGDSFDGIAVGGRLGNIVVGFGVGALCGVVTVDMVEACLCSLRRSAIRMMVRITKTSSLKRS